MRMLQALIVLLLLLAPAAAHGGTLEPGVYRSASGDRIYVGVEHELPDPAVNECYDPRTHRFGELPAASRLTLERGILEERRVVHAPQGVLGVSLYHADGLRRAAVILIHGNDPETREMGFLIPYFVRHGVNVIAYDQRGTGQSTGNWFFSGPEQRASDVEAIIDAFGSDPLLDRARMGVWGFSNGGWTAPIVAARRPLAFMLLKSAPAETIVQNVYYSVEQRMLRYRHTSEETAQAVATWRALIGALDGTTSWDEAKRLYVSAQRQRWFAHSLLPPGLHLPPNAVTADGFRRLMFYDPAGTLRKVRTPTLALFGAQDRNVDVKHASKTLRADFKGAGMRDFTMHVYPHAIHTLVVTSNGFTPALPERLAPGYPEVMVRWLGTRGFLKGMSGSAPRR